MAVENTAEKSVEEEKWEPSQSDIEWQKNLLDRCNEGATWGCDAGIYSVSGKTKTLTRLLPGPDSETHERIKIVLGKIGWKMEDKVL
jgi:hypothetical protein